MTIQIHIIIQSTTHSSPPHVKILFIGKIIPCNLVYDPNWIKSEGLICGRDNLKYLVHSPHNHCLIRCLQILVSPIQNIFSEKLIKFNLQTGKQGSRVINDHQARQLKRNIAVRAKKETAKSGAQNRRILGAPQHNSSRCMPTSMIYLIWRIKARTTI